MHYCRICCVSVILVASRLLILCDGQECWILIWNCCLTFINLVKIFILFEVLVDDLIIYGPEKYEHQYEFFCECDTILCSIWFLWFLWLPGRIKISEFFWWHQEHALLLCMFILHGSYVDKLLVIINGRLKLS